MLRMLKNSFKAIQEHYDYQFSKPSHQWDSEENKHQFVQLFYSLLEPVEQLLKKEATIIKLSAPTYVLGDLHGNYKDLMFFEESFWKFGVKLCPANILFLGDFVDRGPHSVELVAYLFANKVLQPKKWFLLRGNQ